MQGQAGLVCDIGGTNARFAIARFGPAGPVLENVMSLPGAQYRSVEAAAVDYLSGIAPVSLSGAVAACAGPVVEGGVAFTNLDWATTEVAFGAAIGLPRLYLINDLEAAAWAAPLLKHGHLRQVGSVAVPPNDAGTSAILNAGTGCNASALVSRAGSETVVVGEFGHTGFAPCDDQEIALWRWLHARFGHVSIERLLCGPGLLNVYLALCDISGVQARFSTPAEVGRAAEAGEQAAFKAAAQFCAILGSAAGDVALCFGARGGVFLAGGVALSVLREAHDGLFRARFEAKGRFQPYLAAIPTWLIRDTNTALIGAARALAARTRDAPLLDEAMA